MGTKQKTPAREVVLGVRFTAQELKMIADSAFALGMKTSAWVRWKVIEIVKRAGAK